VVQKARRTGLISKVFSKLSCNLQEGRVFESFITSVLEGPDVQALPKLDCK
jgi:hypothetical protein